MEREARAMDSVREESTRLRWSGLALSCALLGFVPAALATTYTATRAADLQPLTDGLVAGDLLLVAPGTYAVSTWRIRNLQGAPGSWIEIRAMAGGPVTIAGNANQNVVNVDDVSFLRFSGFEITYTGGNGDIDGLKFNSGTNSDHVLLDSLWIHDVTGVALNSKAGELSQLDVSRCQLERTAGTGEGMYLGCNGASCWIRDATIRQNWVHDTGGSQGDGIELKPGSYRNVVEDNVVHDTNGWVGITLYRTQRGDIADNNLVRRNASWASGECYFAAAETTLLDNIAFDCAYGINTNNHSGLGVSDLIVAHSTVFDCSAAGIRLGGWDAGTGLMAAVGNASYQTGAGSPALRAPNGLGAALVEANLHFGTSEWGGGASPAGPPGADLVNPVSVPGAIDLRPAPGSALLDAGPSAPPWSVRDLELRPRDDGAPDAGAYESSAAGGWQVGPGFKPLPEDAGPVHVSDGTASASPLRVRKTAAGTLRFTWDAELCRSWNYHLVGGELASVATLAVTERSCYLGNQGSFEASPPPGGGDLWFLIVGGGDDQTAGPLGRDSLGAWRPDTALGSCGLERAAPPRACE